jgi:hypothetical protein
MKITLEKNDQTYIAKNPSGEIVCALRFVIGNIPPNYAHENGRKYKSIKALKDWAKNVGFAIYFY